MTKARTLVAMTTAVLAWSGPLQAQRQEIEPYQMLSVLVGYGGIGPVEETGFRDDGAADAGAGVQFAAGLERRQLPSLFVYGRIDGDVAQTRQHLGATMGLRLELPDIDRFRPYAGGGGGVLWLQPRTRLSRRIDSELALRAEAIAGADWRFAEGIRLIGEYRLTGARYHAVGTASGCPSLEPEACLEATTDKLLHVGHAGWIGLRLVMF